MLGREKTPEPQKTPEPRPYGVRISALGPDERAIIAEHRIREFDQLLKASGCSTMPDPAGLAVNFHTGEHLMVLQVDRVDPRRIRLMMAFEQSGGDFAKAKQACLEATSRQFASKATVEPVGNGYMVTISVGVYAEAAHAFGDSLKAYVDDVSGLLNDFVDLMSSDGR